MNANTLITQLNNPVVLQKINQRSAIIVSLLLIVACVFVLVEITWMFFPQDKEVVAPTVKPSQPVNSRQEQQRQFRQLTQANIFGVSKKAAPKRQTKAPITKLNYKLKGVLAALPMELASAIISQGRGGKENIYGVGDKLNGGVSIKEIHPEHVVLERGGKEEILKLQKVSGVNLKSTGKSAWQQTSVNNSGNKAGQALSQIRKDIMKNPASFGDYALPVLVKENGKQIGYRLKAQKKGKLLSELGIQEGDVITQINGVKLDKAQNGISALRKLSTAKNLNMMVKRGGATIPLNISLN